MKVFLNGSITEASDACISINDGGLLFGTGLFEIMRAANGKVFAQQDHLARLFASAQRLGVPIGMEKAYLSEAIQGVLKANGLAEARIRLTVTTGSMSGEHAELRPTVLITASAFEGYPRELYEKGATVILSGARQNPTDPTCGHQVLNYFARLISLEAARRKMAIEAIWFTFENKLAEGAMSNIFLVKDGKLLTPALNIQIVPGVVRKHVLAIAGANGIETSERDLFVTDLLGADEVFLTSTVMHILPVTKLEAHAVKDSKIGPVTSKLMAAMAEHFKKETA